MAYVDFIESVVAQGFEDISTSGCICEKHPMSLQVFRADEWNYNRGCDQAEWEVPDWVRDAARVVEDRCTASDHYGRLRLDEQYGRDVLTVDDKNDMLREQMEEDLHRASIADPCTVYGETSDSADFRAEDEERRTQSFIEEKMNERRQQLVDGLVELGYDPKNPAVVERIQARIVHYRTLRPQESMAHSRLRAYSSCLARMSPRLKAARQGQLTIGEEVAA